jgi:hypothetical protein
MGVKFLSVRTEDDGPDVVVHLEAEQLRERLGRHQVDGAEPSVERDLGTDVANFLKMEKNGRKKIPFDSLDHAAKAYYQK